MALFKITCNEAAEICDKSQYNESTLFEKIKLMIHFIRCKTCRIYTKYNNKLSILIKGNKASIGQKKQNCLTEKDKKQLKLALEKRIL